MIQQALTLIYDSAKAMHDMQVPPCYHRAMISPKPSIQAPELP